MQTDVWVIYMDEEKQNTTKKLQDLVKKRGSKHITFKQTLYNKNMSRTANSLTTESYSYFDE